MSAGEIWSLALDPQQQRVAIGSVDPELHMYAVRSTEDSAQLGKTPSGVDREGDANGLNSEGEGRRHDTLTMFGAIAREATHRVAHLEFSANGAFLATCSTGVFQTTCDIIEPTPVRTPNPGSTV